MRRSRHIRRGLYLLARWIGLSEGDVKKWRPSRELLATRSEIAFHLKSEDRVVQF